MISRGCNFAHFMKLCEIMRCSHAFHVDDDLSYSEPLVCTVWGSLFMLLLVL
jgi:hypothetical protein